MSADRSSSIIPCMLLYRSIHPKHENPCEKKERTLIWRRVIFQNFRKVRFRVSLFFFFFFLEMLTPLEKASSMRNAMEKSVYGKRFKSIYPSSDIRPFNSTFNVINLSINLSNNFNLSSMLLS